MKRILVLILAIIFITFPLTVSAAGEEGNIYTINTITVEFSKDSSFTPEEQLAIAEYVANPNYDNNTSTYNVLCTLFGHKTTTESFTVVEHQVSATAPRCLRSIQDVTTCSRCDYVYTDVVTSNYIFCCD